MKTRRPSKKLVAKEMQSMSAAIREAARLVGMAPTPEFVALLANAKGEDFGMYGNDDFSPVGFLRSVIQVAIRRATLETYAKMMAEVAMQHAKR